MCLEIYVKMSYGELGVSKSDCLGVEASVCQGGGGEKGVSRVLGVF